MRSMINKEASDFSIQACHNGEFTAVTKKDILGSSIQNFIWILLVF